jgi:hypothetical protein
MLPGSIQKITVDATGFLESALEALVRGFIPTRLVRGFIPTRIASGWHPSALNGGFFFAPAALVN